MSNPLHPFVESGIASAREHIETARFLLDRLTDQPTVIADVHSELLLAIGKLGNVGQILKAAAEAERQEQSRGRDIDRAGSL